MNNYTKGILAVLIAVVLWASTYAVIKIGLESIKPITYGFIRSVIASIFLLSIILLKRQTADLVKIFKENLVTSFFIGFTGIFLLSIFQNVGLERTSSALASVLLNTNPLFILFLAVIFLKERMDVMKVSGAILGSIGIGVIVLVGEDLTKIFQSQSFLGNTLLIGAAISWSIYLIINKSIMQKYNALILTFVTFSIGSTMLFVPAFIFEPIGNLFSLNLQSWLIILYYGIAGSALAFLLWNYSISKIDVSKAAIFLYLIPVLAIGIGMVVLHEQLTIVQIGGILLVFLGIYLTEKKTAKFPS